MESKWLFGRKQEAEVGPFSAWNITGTYRDYLSNVKRVFSGTWKFLNSLNSSSKFQDFQKENGNSVVELVAVPTKITGVHYVQGVVVFHDVFDNEQNVGGAQINLEAWNFLLSSVSRISKRQITETETFNTDLQFSCTSAPVNEMEKHCNIEIAAQVSRVASSENSMHSNFKHRSDLDGDKNYYHMEGLMESPGVGDDGDCFSPLLLNATSVNVEVYYNKAVNYTLMFHNYMQPILLLMYSFWIPQIVANVVRDSRKPLHPYYILGMTATRLAIPLYVFGCPHNFMRVEPNKVWCICLCTFMGLQAVILLLQHYFGSRCFVPRQFGLNISSLVPIAKLFLTTTNLFLHRFAYTQMLPEKYNYHRRFNRDVSRTTDCVICMTAIDLRQHTSDCMVLQFFPASLNYIFSPIDRIMSVVVLKTEMDGYKNGVSNLSAVSSSSIEDVFGLLGCTDFTQIIAAGPGAMEGPAVDGATSGAMGEHSWS
nr:hypothetical protein F20O9.50 - Arabidopsis thaliana [Arabidopsis thaliana]